MNLHTKKEKNTIRLIGPTDQDWYLFKFYCEICDR